MIRVEIKVAKVFKPSITTLCIQRNVYNLQRHDIRFHVDLLLLLYGRTVKSDNFVSALPIDAVMFQYHTCILTKFMKH